MKSANFTGGSIKIYIYIGLNAQFQSQHEENSRTHAVLVILSVQQRHGRDNVCRECMPTYLIIIDTVLWVVTPRGLVDIADISVSEEHECFTNKHVIIITIRDSRFSRRRV